MDETQKTMLVAQATADVIAFMRSLVVNNLTDLKEHAIFIGELEARLGMPAGESKRMFYATATEAKKDFDAEVERMAMAEVGLAIDSAEIECRLFDLWKSDLDRTLEMQLDVLSDSKPVNDEYLGRYEAFNNQLRNQVQKMHDDLSKLVGQMHLLKLNHCFRGHLISNETTTKLVNLYQHQ